MNKTKKNNVRSVVIGNIANIRPGAIKTILIGKMF